VYVVTKYLAFDINDMQFGFMRGKGTTDAIFIVRHMQEKSRAKGMKLYLGFVDLEKAFDRVLREVIRWAVHNLGVEEWLASAVMSMYTGARTVVRTVYGNSNGFEVKVGMYQPLPQNRYCYLYHIHHMAIRVVPDKIERAVKRL